MIKIKITQNVLEKHFTIKHRGKFYYVSYLDSDGPIMGLLNRDYWEVIDEELEEIEDENLKQRLISFCIKHFNDYKPDVED